MVPSSEAQAMEMDPWQKVNAFIFQPRAQTKGSNQLLAW